MYPRPDRAHILGLCTGGFAAAVVAASGTIADLTTAGTTAVTVAFRTGLKSMRAMIDIEPVTNPAGSWSHALHGSEAETIRLVTKFNESRVRYILPGDPIGVH